MLSKCEVLRTLSVSDVSDDSCILLPIALLFVIDQLIGQQWLGNMTRAIYPGIYGTSRV
jgi:hypothetical protein